MVNIYIWIIRFKSYTIATFPGIITTIFNIITITAKRTNWFASAVPYIERMLEEEKTATVTVQEEKKKIAEKMAESRTGSPDEERSNRLEKQN